VPAPAVSCSLLQGFLLPGGAEKDLPPFLAGSLLSLRVPGNPLPFALGKMAVSRTEALREGMKGRGMEVLHVYGAPVLLPPP
jgi:translation initiation factor 2D